MSKRSYDRLKPEQQKVIIHAAHRARKYFFGEAKKLDDEMVEQFKKSGVEIVEMSKENYDAWLAIAKESSYKEFAAKVPNGQALIDKALAVE